MLEIPLQVMQYFEGYTQLEFEDPLCPKTHPLGCEDIKSKYYVKNKNKWAINTLTTGHIMIICYLIVNWDWKWA